MANKIRGMSHTVSAGFVRPANTTAYTAGDVVSGGGLLVFAGASLEPGGAGIVQHATLVDSANVATKPDLELWLFDTPIELDADNAAFTPTDEDLRTFVGAISLAASLFKVGDATSGAGGNCICDVPNIGMPFNTVIGSTLYGVLVVRNAYVPVSAERFDVRLKVLD